jgi:hypothetical protein
MLLIPFTVVDSQSFFWDIDGGENLSSLAAHKSPTIRAFIREHHTTAKVTTGVNVS